MRKIIATIISILDSIIIKDNKQFAFSSFPDVSDNSYAMFKYLYLKFSSENAKFVWLISDMNKLEDFKKNIKNNLSIKPGMDCKNIIFIKKNSMRGILYYTRSKYVFFTHGLYPEVYFPNNHIIINLWHGMPLKNIGLLDDKNKGVAKFSFTIATSSFFQRFMSKAFGVEHGDVLISGQPRNDLLFEKNNCFEKLSMQKDTYNKLFLWTPTYRKSIIGDIRSDGISRDVLPVIGNDIDKLNSLLKEINSFMIIKLHPMDNLMRTSFDQYTNLVVLKNEDLEAVNCQLYALLGEVDVLLTDFSSIYIDYLLLNRPIGFIIDDFDEYSQSRGFIVSNPEELMPGELISSRDDLFDFLMQCTEDKDNYSSSRIKINNMFNEQKLNFSEELWNMIIDSGDQGRK